MSDLYFLYANMWFSFLILDRKLILVIWLHNMAYVMFADKTWPGFLRP